MLSSRAFARTLLFTVAMVSLVSDASACSGDWSGFPGSAEALASSAYVVEATARSQQLVSEPDPDSGRERSWREVSFEVRSVWAGEDVPREVVVRTPANPMACGMSYEMGSTYLLYAGWDPAHGTLVQYVGHRIAPGIDLRTGEDITLEAERKALGEPIRSHESGSPRRGPRLGWIFGQ